MKSPLIRDLISYFLGIIVWVMLFTYINNATFYKDGMIKKIWQILTKLFTFHLNLTDGCALCHPKIIIINCFDLLLNASK